jgi:glutamate carboxypeptidase
VTRDLVSDIELAGLRARFEAELPAFLADLERLCSIDCGSYTPAGVNEVADWVAAFLAGIGASVERRPDPAGRFGDTIVATVAGPRARAREARGLRILLIGHMDTVFEAGTASARPFRIDDGVARGPGVTDMKSGLLAGLYAVRAVLASGSSALERLVLIANPDEEVGSPSSTPHIRAAAAASDACLVLECARANGDFVSARKGIADLRVRIHGRAAHAGVEPEKGRSAIAAGAYLVTAIQGLNGRWPDVTANVGVFRAGTRPNIVPDDAALEIDVRAMTRASLEAALAAVREIVASPGVADVSTEVETMATWLPMERLPRSARLAEHVIDLAARLGFTTTDVATGGASDANTTAGLGVPTIDGLGPIGGRDHSPDEYLEVGSVVPRTTLLAALLLALGRDPEVLAWRAEAREG